MTRAALIGVLLSSVCLASVAGASAPVRGVTTEASGQAGAMGGGPVAMSADGRYVVFVTGGPKAWPLVYVRDRKTLQTTLVSIRWDGINYPDGPVGELPEPFRGGSYVPVGISGDGRVVAFTSWANDLLASDRGAGFPAVFLTDLETHVTTDVGAGEFEAISADGGEVALVDDTGLEVRDLASGATTTVTNESVSAASLSADGRFVAFSARPGGGGQEDVFVRGLATGATSLVSIARDGGPANGDSGTPSISANGRYVAFESEADNLVRGDRNSYKDVFLRDVLAGKTTRMSGATNGAEGLNPGTPAQPMDENGVAISADGRFVAFASHLQDLVPGDGNHQSDVFVHDRRSGVTSLVSVTRNGGIAGHSEGPLAISDHGRVVAFGSGAKSLVAHPERGWGVFVRDLRVSKP
jgi:Tol biopolymer transport system component